MILEKYSRWRDWCCVKGLEFVCSGGGWLFKYFVFKFVIKFLWGFYLYGGVGMGKIMVMDMFYE